MEQLAHVLGKAVVWHRGLAQVATLASVSVGNTTGVKAYDAYVGPIG